MRFLLVILLCAPAIAQTLTLGAPVKGEFSATIEVRLATAGASIAALQAFVVSTPPAPVSMAIAAGPALTAAGKTLTCQGGQCVAAGGDSAIGDGLVAIITLTATKSASFFTSLSGLLGASPAADPVPITTPGPVAVSIKSRCDLNGDGKTDLLDVAGAMVQATGGASCSSADITGRGKCDIWDVRRIVTAASGSACVAGP